MMKKLITILFLLGPLYASAQEVPNLHVRLYGGWNTANLVYKIENVEPDLLAGWQAGGGFRVGYRREMYEVGIVFINSGITVAPNEDADIVVTEPIDIRMRSLEIPLMAGWIPIKTPIFKWYLYGGLASRFSLKGKYTYQGEEGTFKPKELRLNWYNLGARLGTQIDFTYFNFEFSYTIGITNSIKSVARTNTHYLQLSLGLLF